MRFYGLIITIIGFFAAIFSKIYNYPINEWIFWKGFPIPYLVVIKKDTGNHIDDFFLHFFILDWLFWGAILLLIVKLYIKLKQKYS